jgi:hypothetical protein
MRETIGLLHLLWWWCLDYAQDGDLMVCSDEDIADAVLWEGDAQELREALTAVGFLEDGVRIHDWHEYAGKLIEKREANAERMRRARATHPPKDVPPTPGERAAHMQRTNGARAGATVPNRTEPNQTVPNPPTADAVAPPPPKPTKLRAVPSFTDAERERLDAVGVILGPLGLALDATEGRQVLDRYGGLDLELEASRQRDWCKRHRIRAVSLSRYTNWLGKALADLPPPVDDRTPMNGRARVIPEYRPPPDAPVPEPVEGCPSCAKGWGPDLPHPRGCQRRKEPAA